jgi:elongation factor Ts
VTMKSGDDAVAKDIAMHVAAINPARVSASEVPADEVAKEREILLEQAKNEGKPEAIVAKMVEGRLRKWLNEITLLGQPFVKDPDQSVEKYLKQAGGEVIGFVRYEVGAGIEKKKEDFAEEVRKQAFGGDASPDKKA